MPVGEKTKLMDLKKMVDEDEEHKNLTIEDQIHIKNILLQHRELNRSGARPSNRAAAQDTRWTIDRVSKEVSV